MILKNYKINSHIIEYEKVISNNKSLEIKIKEKSGY